MGSVLNLVPPNVLDRASANVRIPGDVFVLDPSTGLREPQFQVIPVNLYFKESGTKGNVKVYLFNPELLTPTQLQSLIGEPFEYQFSSGDRGWVVLDRIVNQPSPIAVELLGYCFQGRKANGRDELRMGR